MAGVVPHPGSLRDHPGHGPGICFCFCYFPRFCAFSPGGLFVVVFSFGYLAFGTKLMFSSTQDQSPVLAGPDIGASDSAHVQILNGASACNSVFRPQLSFSSKTKRNMHYSAHTQTQKGDSTCKSVAEGNKPFFSKVTRQTVHTCIP